MKQSPEEWRDMVRNKFSFLSERRPSMNESKYKPVLILRFDKNTGDFVGMFPENAIEPVRGDNISAVMDAAAEAVGKYKSDLDVTGRRLAVIDEEIQRLRVERERLEVEQTEAADLPLYSILNPADRALYVMNNQGLDPDRINWYEAKYKKNIIGVDFIPNPFEWYGTDLIWRWYTLPVKDTDNG